MALAANQITDLFIWVHPEYLVTEDHVAKASELFIEALATEPHGAVIELPSFKRPRSYADLNERCYVSKSDFPVFFLISMEGKQAAAPLYFVFFIGSF